MISAVEPTGCPANCSTAVVVPNFNGGSRVLNTLDSLMSQPFSFESITVVDNGSTDGSPRAITERFPSVHLLELGENRGLPAARNAGLESVSTDRVLMVDADVILDVDAVKHMDSTMSQSGAAVVCPRIRLHPERHIVQADGAMAHFIGTMSLRHANQPLDSLETRRAEVGGCIGACLLFDRQAVIEAGGFDPLYFFYFEDLEFMLKMRCRGYRFICEPQAVVFHDRGSGTEGLSFRGRATDIYPARRVFITHRNRWLVMLTYYRKRTLVLLLPALFTYELATLTLVVFRGWLGPWFRAAGWILAHPQEILRRRRAAQGARTRPDREMLEGGPLPLAPGLLKSRVAATLVECLSRLLNAWWKLIRPLV